MQKNIITLFSTLVVLLFHNSCFSQEDKFNQSWEISFSSGQSFVDNIDRFGISYSRGLTFNPEVTCNISKLVSASLSMLFTTAHWGSDNADYKRVFNVDAFDGVSVFNHYQTTIAPIIRFSPINFKMHKLIIGVGPTYTLGNTLLSETVSEVSTTQSDKISEFGYLGSLGYKFAFSKNWTIGGTYIYSKDRQKT